MMENIKKIFPNDVTHRQCTKTMTLSNIIDTTSKVHTGYKKNNFAIIRKHF